MESNLQSNRQIKLGAMMSYFTIAFSIISGLIYTPWMVKQIGQSDYGIYMLTISLISIFAMDFGLGSAVSRFMTKYKALDDQEGAKRFLGIVYKLFIAITAVILMILIIVYFLIENIYTQLSIQEIEKLKVIFIISSMIILVSFPTKPFDGILVANERFIFLKLLDLLNKILTVFLMVIAILLGYGLYAIIVVNASVVLLIIIIKYFYIQYATNTEVDFSFNGKYVYKEIFVFSSWATVIAIAQRFILNITPTILAALAGSIHVAVFAIGMTIEGYIWSISAALGGLFLPKVTKIIVKNDNIQEIENLFMKVGRIQLFIVGLIIAIFTSMGYEFMEIWMGENFTSSYYVALLLILPGLITFTQEIAYTALVAMNEIRYRAMASLIVAIISVVLSLFLSKEFGAIGAAVAIFIGNVVGLIVFMNIIYHKLLKLNIFRFFKECHLKMALPLIITIIIGSLFQTFLPVHSLLLFILKALLLSLIYYTLSWMISLNQYEKNLFRSFFGKFMKKTLNKVV